MEFRKDINGLRAVAVLAVMFYHFGVPGFGSGFAGVDIFFVISGFLMTAILVGAKEKDAFSIPGFYLARAKRILPALTALCAVLLLAGWFLLPPVDYKQLGEHAGTSLAFVSNFVYQGEDGYFDTLSQEKWLLHTWSLSVEWQFYLLYPLLLAGLWRKDFSLPRTEKTLAALAALSLAVSAWFTPTDGAFAFYLLPARIWELAAGGLVFLLGRRLALSPARGMAAHVIGLALVAASVVVFGGKTPWPGVAALAPVLGAALVILGARQGNPLLSAAPVQAAGRWSYSIYLWHWPLLVALRYVDMEHDPAWRAAALALSVALGALSYRFVETPVRRAQAFRTEPRRAAAAVCGAALVFCLAGMGAHYTKGAPWRVSPQVQAIADAAPKLKGRRLDCISDKTKGTDEVACTDNDLAYAVWGDSHASALLDAIATASGGAHGRLYTKSCPPLLRAAVGTRQKSKRCLAFSEQTVKEVFQLPPETPLILIFRFSYYLKGYNENPEKPVDLHYADIPDAEVKKDPDKAFSTRLVETICTFAKGRKNVYVVQPVPEMGVDVPRTLSRNIMLYGKTGDVSLPLAAYEERHRVTLAALNEAKEKCGVRLLDPVPYLCRNGACDGSVGGVPLYFDDDHLSIHGDERIAPMFRQVFSTKTAGGRG